jgi:hypothetical protein
MVNNFKEAFNDPVPNRLREPTGNRHGRLDDSSLEAAIKSIEQILVKLLASHPDYMKSPPCSSLLKTALLIVQLVLCFGGPTVAQAGGKDPLSPGPVRPGNLDYQTELPQGYLRVYSATDKFNDGDAWYFPHSSYAIYTIDGKLFKNVKNHRSADDEVPEVVALPVGTYTVVARSERDGYGHVLVVIKEGQQAILDLDLWETKTQRSLAHN